MSRPLTEPEIMALLQDEFRYWSESNSSQEREQLIAIGGAGALSNVMAVMRSGRPAPWHKSHPNYDAAAFAALSQGNPLVTK